MSGRVRRSNAGAKWFCAAVAGALAASPFVASAATAPAGDLSGTWYWRSLESGINRWHTSQGEGTVSRNGASFELDLRDGASGILAYHLTVTRSGSHLKAIAVVPDSDRDDIVLVGDIDGVGPSGVASRQTIVFRGPYTVLALTRDPGAMMAGDIACRDPRFDALVARGSRVSQATQVFALPSDAWKTGDNTACATVLFNVGADGRAEGARVVESYPADAATRAALETIRSFHFQAPAKTKLGLRFRIYHPATE